MNIIDVSNKFVYGVLKEETKTREKLHNLIFPCERKRRRGRRRGILEIAIAGIKQTDAFQKHSSLNREHLRHVDHRLYYYSAFCTMC
jgi:hypothetical protein